MKRKRGEIFFNDTALQFLGKDSDDYNRAARLVAPITTLPTLVNSDSSKMARLISIGARDNKDDTFTLRIEFEWFKMDNMLYLTEVPLQDERAFIEHFLDDREVVEGQSRRVFQLIVKREKN